MGLGVKAMGIFDAFGGGSPPPTYQTNNTNPQQGLAGIQPGTVIMTDNTTGVTPLGTAQIAQQYSAAQQSMGLGQVLQENTTLLRQLKDELLPLRKWLIETYPDIYKQYQAVETLRDLGKVESK